MELVSLGQDALNRRVLKVESVSVRRDKTWLLRDLSWTVSSGEQWAIIGANGAGKSTLMKVLQGYEWPTKGQVEVLGRTLGQTDVRELRTRMAWVGHDLVQWLLTHHGRDTVQLVVASGLGATIGAGTRSIPVENILRADELLIQLGLDMLKHRPFHQLSQGERQRVLLARAWLSRSSLLIFDEVSAGLDIGGRQSVYETLSILTRQPQTVPAVIYVTHHVEEIGPWISHVLVMRNGQVIAQGRRKDILRDDVLSETFGVNIHLAWQDNRAWAQVSR